MTDFLFQEGDSTQSKFFRIPFLWTAEDGTLIAGTDANFGSTGDSAENIDVAIRTLPRSQAESGGKWSEAFIPPALHMQDYADEVGYKQQSASFIDAVIFEDRIHTGRLIIHLDAWTWNGGLFAKLDTSPNKAHRMREVAKGSGFCEIDNRSYLLLSSHNRRSSADDRINNINANTDLEYFDYVADLAPDTAAANNAFYPIYELHKSAQGYSLGSRTNYQLNQDYELWESNEALFIQQKSDNPAHNKRVPMKIFYEDSILQMYNTSYIIQFTSSDQGRSWQTDRILNPMVKAADSRAYITGPGRGAQIHTGPYRGRLLSPTYFQKEGRMYSQVIYSDDGGLNWKAGAAVDSPVQTSEAAPVVLHDGSVRLFMRNTAQVGGRILEAHSNDGGQTWAWVGPSFNDEKAVGINCQVSAIRLDRAYSFKGRPYQLILLASANDRARKDGRIFIGRLPLDAKSDDRIDWFDEIEVTGADKRFGYSCLTALDDETIALLYESSENDSWEDGLQRMYYDCFNLPL